MNDLSQLKRTLTGEVIEPEDERYEPGKEAFYREFNRRRPLALIRVARPSDVPKVIQFAGETGVKLAVRAGGHSLLGHSLIDGGLVLDLSALRTIRIDADGRSATAGGGVLAGEYTLKAAEFGLATGFGDTGSVGIAGLTLGGGVGFLHRKIGLTIDNLLGAEIVTADGAIRQIDHERDSDLFWAIRGGGGSFGVVTELEYRLHPVDSVVGGMLILPATPQAVTDFVATAREASEDLSAIAGLMVAPPMPFLPEEVHGQMVLMLMMVHLGDPPRAEKEIERFRRIAQPLVDTVHPMPYTEMFPPEEGGPPHPEAMTVFSIYSDDFTLDDASSSLEALRNSAASMSVVQIRVLGGAVARVPADATAFPHRNREMIINVAAAFEDPAERPDHQVWADNLATRLQRGVPGGYLNFLGDDSTGSVRAAFPGGTWERLVAVKSKYDPNEVFASTYRIPPRPVE
ncbi:MAG TPA: FAD-binding oxidoreductase [Acidimicrobiia bacterium]|nr:FAD-binding oxidoreductase [Acidimicrobiia bacterium]